MEPQLLASGSLPEVHGSIATSRRTLIRRMFAFAGPAYLVSVGYMDPGNWATDLEGGARFGYGLLWVLVLSNLMAILLQTLSSRLGIVAGRDLAQACRDAYPRSVTNALWVLCEIAIAACDLAEVLGAAIALHLLFGLPLLIGVVVTAFDTILVLWLSRYGIRIVEAMILVLIAVIAGCFVVEILFAKPVLHEVLGGLIPRLNSESLYVAIGILGATVMPHNLYLHSALVQTRQIGKTIAEKRTACRYNFADSVIALNAALIVNAAILILAGAVFFKKNVVVTQIEQAHELLTPLMGTALASGLFAVALLASGQSSTLTGTFAGQIVMEGFLDLRLRPWLRRMITRSLAIIPAVITIWYMGPQGTLQLIILSQVILSMQLPFAVIPLIRFTSDRAVMGEFASALWVKVLSWSCAFIILGLNFWYAGSVLGPWIRQTWWHGIVAAPPLAGVVYLLFRISFPGERHKKIDPRDAGVAVAANLPTPVYRRILVPLDHSQWDRAAIAHASALALAHHSTIYLIHVEEDVTSQLYGSLSTSAEVTAGKEYLQGIVRSLSDIGISVDLNVVHGRKPKDEIVKAARAIDPDLIVMGAHGHRGLKDLIFGNTINAVRHEVSAPVLVVGSPGNKH